MASTERQGGAVMSGRPPYVVHMCYVAVPGCPRPDLCYGQICIAPEICHDPAVQADPEGWRRRLDALAAGLQRMRDGTGQ